MKAKKKPRGIKQKIHDEKEREKRIALSIFAAIILIAIISISGFLVNSMLNQPSTNQTVNPSSEPKAAIVDHLSLTYPNQTFIQTATNILRQVGYRVDYYPGEQVTVDFYRNLPTHGYSLIILRVHSTTGGYPSLSLFTSEPHSLSKYSEEQIYNRIVRVAYSREDAEKGRCYFGITPSFVESSMNGKFANTIVIMMGCEGLNNTKMARAFVEKGTKVYISWNNPVSASHTDMATTHLLQHFLIEKLTLIKSLQETFKEVGPAPTYSTLLIYYPPEVGEQTIEDIIGK